MKLLEKSLVPNRIPPLKSDFFLRDTVTVAKELLGKGLYVRHPSGEFLCELIEVEAYLGQEDEASHSARGLTARNQSMFAIGGTAYVYLIYGFYHCLNVSTEAEQVGAAVLFRAGKPLKGLPEMHKNRGLKGKIDEKKLLSGPGKLAQALKIDKRFDGRTFKDPHFKIIDLGNSLKESQIVSSPRIGISKAQDKHLRFFIKDSPWVSQKRP